MMQVTRRQMLQGLVGLGLGVGCTPWPWQAPPPRVPRVGLLSGGSAASPNLTIREAFRQGLQELGYVEGQNIIIERRYAEGQLARLPELTAELVALPVDVIVTLGTFTGEAARDATS